jgi:hypothetical protein
VRDQADILILLSHVGLSANHQIATQVSEIDLIVSGGGKETLSTPQSVGDGPAIVHADAGSPGHAGRRIGIGTWSFDPQGELVGQNWENLLLGPEIPEDPDLLAWLSANQ